jgi:hypothetical protein
MPTKTETANDIVANIASLFIELSSVYGFILPLTIRKYVRAFFRAF